MSQRAVAARVFPDSVGRLRDLLMEDSRVTPAMLQAIGGLDWAMALPSAAAPGFVYLAGAVGGEPVGGGGAELAEAAGRLAGEACEVDAQRRPPPEAGPIPADPALVAIWGDGPSMAATDLTRAAPAGAPMAAIFPAVPAAPEAPPRSLGLAAARSPEAARLAGLLELVERDAAAAWWHGAAAPRAVDLCVAEGAAAELAAMRSGAAEPRRATTLLALPAAAGVPVVCAMSRDASGRGLAFGLKAALHPAEAARGATRELLQMEIALEIAALRASQDRETPGDAAVLRRGALDPDGFAAFAARSAAASPDPPRDLDELVARLGAVGVGVIAVDLAAPSEGLAVAKMFAAGLRPLPGPGAPPRPGAPGALAGLM